ncbi:hypothetical protein DI494_22350 [Stenotrophomonas maltophilia]|nr:hypothetical protein DI494_22350 [Stenotrophomonas maltophilia]
MPLLPLAGGAGVVGAPPVVVVFGGPGGGAQGAAGGGRGPGGPGGAGGGAALPPAGPVAVGGPPWRPPRVASRMTSWCAVWCSNPLACLAARSAHGRRNPRATWHTGKPGPVNDTTG